jgi:hypothetical protein
MSTGGQGGATTDPFDRVYSYWAEQAIGQRKEPPSRERWDAIVLRLILSEDPDRMRRYRNLEATGPGSLGADAYELWSKMPAYTPNLSVPSGNWPDFHAYEEAHRGSMKRHMGGQGLLDTYNEMVSGERRSQEPKELTEAQQAKAKRAQANVMIIGCVGMAAIAFMILTVLLIIAFQL